MGLEAVAVTLYRTRLAGHRWRTSGAFLRGIGSLPGEMLAWSQRRGERAAGPTRPPAPIRPGSVPVNGDLRTAPASAGTCTAGQT